MSPTSEPRRQGPRVRARAKAGASADLRPEVAQALGGLERSIGDVAEWEHLLTTSGDGSPTPGPADVVVRARVRPQVVAPPIEEPVEVAPAPVPPIEAPGPRRRGRRVLAAPPPVPAALPPSLILPALAEVDPVAPVPLADDPTLDVTGLAVADGGAFPEPDLDLSPLHVAPAADPMATWVEHTSSPHRFGLTPEAARRQRNGRILSWAGAVLLVAAAAYLLIPDHSPDRPTLVPERSTSTTVPSTSTTLQFGSQFSVPSLPPTTAPAVVTPTPTPTTVKSSTKKRSSTTSPPTTEAPVVTLPPAPTTTAPPPPTTAPRPTTTTTTIQTCPSVPGQRPGDC